MRDNRAFLQSVERGMTSCAQIEGGQRRYGYTYSSPTEAMRSDWNRVGTCLKHAVVAALNVKASS